MIVYRLAKRKFIEDLSGKGAEMSGGRWNSKGIPMLYTSESRALCMVEIAVHCPLGIVPSGFYMAGIEIPDSIKIKEVEINSLPGSWNLFPISSRVQGIGDEFIRENKYLVLRVPSAVVKGDHNYLINPRHKDFKKIVIKDINPFEFDTRLFIS